MPEMRDVILKGITQLLALLSAKHRDVELLSDFHCLNVSTLTNAQVCASRHDEIAPRWKRVLQQQSAHLQQQHI